ncbi:class III extradiol ring-cleavage dioxygenase family protein [Pengzhenrongella sicca]|uniref:Uncharacterized protein n=1 Tax=Pengzhenrongella sicca TaxID=2819238 RepID=A0A8A4ZM22_9MICO|nr:hypothetical protein [Pengzhenrongella sicca]QTE30618.1 hypothetical protein J4E96_06545 [Pengzhenrongella sicca]
MLAIAALVPDTALLVPGAAGRAVVLEATREAALAAAREVVAAGPDQIVVVAPGPHERTLPAPARPSLIAAGIADAGHGWPPAEAAAPTTSPQPTTSLPPATPAAPTTSLPPGVAASTVLLLLAAAGWAGPVTVLEVGAGESGAQVLRERGAALAAGAARLALVASGSLSARNGPSAPLPADERAAELDASILADLGAADPAARDRLGSVPADLAGDLAVTAWAPLQVVLGAAGTAEGLAGGVRHTSAPFGVTYAVAVWRPSGPAVASAAGRP